MFERAKAWVKKHPVLTRVITITVTFAGAVVVDLILIGKDDENQFQGTVITSMPKLNYTHDLDDDLEFGAGDDSGNFFSDVLPGSGTPLIEDEPIAIEVGGVMKTFPRTDFVRILHEGQQHSDAAAEKAAALGIDLEPGETYVRPTIVNRKAV